MTKQFFTAQVILRSVCDEESDSDLGTLLGTE